MSKHGEKATPAQAAAGAKNLRDYLEKAPAPPATKHGLRTIRSKVKIRGLSALDMRSLAARQLVEWRNEVFRDLGGEGELSAQQKALVEQAARTKLYVDTLDVWLMEQESIIDKRRHGVLPALRERQGLVDSLVRILEKLGLERRARNVTPRAADYMRKRGEHKDRHGPIPVEAVRQAGEVQ